MAVQLTKEEKLRCENMQVIYDKRVREISFHENTCTFDLIERGLAPTCEQVRWERQQRQEQEFQRRISEVEHGEVIDMVIELADYRRFRCVYAEHHVPKERVVELPSA
jgi:hypothetical protein